MSAYIQGNLALDERKHYNKPVEQQSRSSGKKQYRAKSLPTAEKLLYLFTIIAFCAVAGFITYRYALAFELNSQIVKMESEMNQLKEENAAMKNEVAKLQDPQRLIEKGIQMGLAYPSEWQGVSAVGGSRTASLD